MTSQEEVAVVPSSRTGPTASRGYWVAVLVRAAIALVAAVVVTFSLDHSAPFGFVAFGGFAVASGLAMAIGGWRGLSAGRGPVLGNGILTVVAGGVALANPGGGLPFLIFLLTTWAAVTGFLELYLGLRNRGRSPLSRDWVFAGVLGALLAVAVLLVPPDFAQPFSGGEAEGGVLTASVIVVGIFGAYAAILGVYLAIAGFSLKWSTATPPAESGTT